QILCPWITYSSPSRVAVVRKEARSDPASGSLKPWHQRCRPLIRPGRKRCWTASLACVVIPWTRYPRLGRGGAPAAASSSSRMTSKTAGRSWPPKREGQESPKKPASYSAVCHSACRAQYSSSVEETGRPGLCSVIQARSRDRNCASAGESRKSVGHPQTYPLELAQLLAVVPEPLGGEQCPAGIDVDDAVPRVSDPAVHLHRGLADGTCGARAVGLGHAPRGAGLVGRELVDGPRRIERGAQRPLDKAASLGEEMLHGLEGPDGDAVLPPLPGVGDRDVEDAAHEPDQIGARERQTQGRPRREIVAREAPGLVGNPDHGDADGKRAQRACEVGTVARTVGPGECEPVPVAFGDQDVRRDGTLCGMIHGEGRAVGRRTGHHRG